MLAPVPSRRSDGKSSFKRLGDYLAKEVDPETGEVLDRGEIILSDNLGNLDTAALEMQATAAQSKRLQADPVFHYVLTWQPGEQPTRDQWEQAAFKTLQALGYEEHQFMVAAHADTENFHCHLMVNRVHPETFKPHTPSFYKRELDKTLRQIEAEQGWQHSNGLAYWDEEKGQAIAYTREELDRIRQEQGREKAVHPQANKMEVHGDTASLENYCRGVAPEIKKIMQRPGVNWQHVHAILKHHGLGIQQGELGGYTLHSLNDAEGVRVKASRAFRDVFAGKAQRQKLAELLGDFKPPIEKVQEVHTKATYQKTSVKRDPAMRQERREQREKERKELKSAFASYRKEIGQQRKAMAEQFKGRLSILAKEAQRQRQDYRSRPMEAAERKALLSVLTAETVQQRRALRTELATLAPAMLTYREWVGERAEQGDKAAIAQLRAFNYADKKKQREQQRRDDELATLPGIQSAKRADDDPMVWRKAAELAWRVNRTTGDVTYQMAGREVFTDHGRRLTLTATGSSETQAVLLALEMARHKYGQELTLTGSDEFKRRAVVIAVQNRLDVSFTDPALNALKAELAQPAIVQKSAQQSPVKAPPTPAQELATLKTHYKASGFILSSKDEKTGIKTKAGHEFTGAIVHVGQHVVVQRTGANTLVAHPRAQLPHAAVGKTSVTVQYGNDGRAHIVVKERQIGKGKERA